MILIVGLGNPTSEYKNTRHNIGFMLIDELLAYYANNAHDVSSAKFQGELFKVGKILLLKPQTYMNLSGNSVKAVSDFYKPERIVVIHDDVDLSFGAMRFKKGGSSGGHNGLKSIDGLMGAEYERVRLGVGRSKFAGESTANFVLSDFSEDEKPGLNELLQVAKNAVLELVDSDIKTINQKFSRKGIS
ncbi:aminoacyl-tRNA hydrolase [Campylobacter suis]|uniref:Peptidyl-tRNA hydrolase n=1 Tax=Campylobacter suis TaxID=2790657 RepID=A0ABN7K6B1_9BACT|nr:aminoacyl-tRNA hydrolase [Campylobacter suis]CAD7286222.1 Peptidyl-tRNA hydrolase [Campylobacter suis]